MLEEPGGMSTAVSVAKVAVVIEIDIVGALGESAGCITTSAMVLAFRACVLHDVVEA